MKLQIALDTLTIEECIMLLDEVKDYVDIIEVGTPFLLEEGNKPVKIFKERYPQLEVLADTKIMDAGEYEAEGAFKAGADIVTVLGVTNDATIEGALKAAKKYNGKVMMDMICVADMAKRTQQMDAMGVDYICCHTAFDIQETGKNPLDELVVINQNITNAKSAVAGGVKLETIDEIVAEGAGVIVVGGAISNAKDRIAMAKAIKEHMK
ncbi:3-hexulose-6-phosphate synthase [Breznakia sp. PF5-3]|uniref:3-hexulose-6-phosphate synthase n=1 Tax=unclassified Breznakia TaxID=2623764 RepID=UPI0024058212|nr:MULTISPECIES: 3-hexulose-6-phosphate synthase [unclassified Breznakia]MDF9823825.1 3-hexulose-6-phosphate synthase [Breznakia sp. PM6-1]MDF9834609.1 3-hexulose-6-phosphate synthase [Breznakia sp. PF5-3]MDF9836774.1 3-hexulose-6-phosphate synthase [Breznakia sp. PFB2-8]MDF9858777.1 3-hexulose-6-phosphate synthase [Breznakia sp. PH5-24]